MKIPTITLLFALVASAMGEEMDFKPHLDRYVADGLEIKTLSNGMVITRLVSTGGITVRQFWVSSVYNSRVCIVVFQDRGESTHRSNLAYSGQKYERQVSSNNLMWNDRPDVLIQALGAEHIQ